MPNYLGTNTDELAGVPIGTVVNGSSDPVKAVTVTGSPFSYTVPAYGTVNISGGTVSQVAVKRGSTSTNIGGTAGHFLQSKGDVVVITYSAAPTVVLITNKNHGLFEIKFTTKLI